MPKFTELPGASPPGPPPGLCPGPAGGLTAPPRPPDVFLVPMAAPLPKCFRRACSAQALLMMSMKFSPENFPCLMTLILPSETLPPLKACQRICSFFKTNRLYREIGPAE